jgi:hypothetical protein
MEAMPCALSWYLSRMHFHQMFGVMHGHQQAEKQRDIRPAETDCHINPQTQACIHKQYLHTTQEITKLVSLT